MLCIEENISNRELNSKQSKSEFLVKVIVFLTHSVLAQTLELNFERLIEGVEKCYFF